jgi:ABC-type iron transport system FetAB permease component
VDLAREGNLIEAVVWAVLAVVVVGYTTRAARAWRPTLVVLALTMLVFGASDVVESRTGAWWRPWWLFVWKALCVVALLVGFLRLFRLRRNVQGNLTDGTSGKQ